MARGGNSEADFANDVDRVLAGGESGQDSTRGHEYRANLGFSKTIAGARSTPSPAFQSDLKAKLLSRLAEIETREEREGGLTLKEWIASIFRQRVWQVAAATMAVAVLALVVVWQAGLLSGGPVVTVPYPIVAIEAKASVDPGGYPLGGEVGIAFSFTNLSSGTLSFGLPPAFRIETVGAEAVRSFPVGETVVSLAPGQSTTFGVTWDQTDNTGLQVQPGEYQIVMPNVNLGDAGFLSLPASPTILILGR
jgi:hypothetical protein